MKFHPEIKVYGDINFRGDCPQESFEQITFFNQIRKRYPDTWGRIAVHPRNEGKKSHNQVMREKAEGMTAGASDILIGNFMCELKRRDHTQSAWQSGQQDFLLAAQRCGATVCVALGWQAAMDAFEDYLKKVVYKQE